MNYAKRSEMISSTVRQRLYIMNYDMLIQIHICWHGRDGSTQKTSRSPSENDSQLSFRFNSSFNRGVFFPATCLLTLGTNFHLITLHLRLSHSRPLRKKRENYNEANDEGRKWLERTKRNLKVFIWGALVLAAIPSSLLVRYRKTGAVIKLKWLNGDKWLVTLFDENFVR